ncbi:unnamed protein product [Adineta ricciae]|uniref:Transmembrane protein n=1 Tax=Adineta ricciae TaxID=249248 RepID=A0A815TUD2_ADIRI|nr:unnamed protein product [Adineta ricciae]CAF1588775.1 unnamed protein product [Adineta ricciae]
MSSIKSYLLNLNLLSLSNNNHAQKAGQQQQQHTRLNIICTRVYILFIVMVLFCTGLFLFLVGQTQLILIRNPTTEQFEELPPNTKCSCSQISIPYGKFTSLQATFHQVCSSDFVTDRWIKAINFGENTTYFSTYDFRTYGSAQFQALAGFCRLSKSNSEQSISFFSLKSLLSPEVLPENVFQSQTQSSIDQFQSRAPNTFNSQLRLIHQMTMNNEITSGLSINFYYRFSVQFSVISYVIIQNGYYQIDGPVCFCAADICNASQSAIHNVFAESNQIDIGHVLWILPGISSGCLPTQTLLVSTLECFYNQTCLDRLMFYIPTNENFQAMNILKSTLYQPNSTVQSIVNNLMIEDWANNISYEEYYSECSPSLCTYFQISRRSFIFILTKLISLLASLVLILGIVFSLTIQLIQRFQDKTPRPKTSFCVHLRQWKVLIQQKLIELNMFRKYASTDRQTQYQRYATRFYFILIIISMAIIIHYNATKISIQSKTIHNPSQSQYIELQQEYSRTLSCSCSSILMLYSIFITLQPYYHQLCSSYLVSKEWIYYIRQINNTQGFNAFDFQATAPSQFLSLSMFCQQAKQTVDEASDIFLQTKFISSQVISPQSFELQINSSIEDWKSTTINTFIRTIQLVRVTTQGNQLSNNLNSVTYRDAIKNKIIRVPFAYSECNCALSASCRHSISLPSSNEPYLIPNLFAGCYLIEALFASTLECFYNISCISKINDFFSSSSETFNCSLLDANLNVPNETIETIVHRLMMDNWISNISFTSYYNQCAPSLCTYQYEDRSAFYAVISDIGLIYGGLSLGLKLIILIGLYFIDLIIQNDFFHSSLLQTMKHIFICRTEHQMIDRLHLVLVATTLSILYTYSAFTSQITTVQIQKPSLSIYENLIQQSFDSLECPCSQISIKYKTFLNITPSFHPICSSNLIAKLTSSELFYNYTYTRIVPSSDFLYSASAQFQLLASFCDLSRETVLNFLVELGTSDLISTQLSLSTAFNDQIQRTVNDFQLTMPELFVNTLSLIREITGANMLTNTLSTNWIFDTSSGIINGWTMHQIPLNYDGCSCAVSSKCVSPSGEGMFAGCYPLESILQSTLACFYNQNCLDQLFDGTVIRNISALTSSRFSSNATFESIVNELMIEKLTSNMSYELYFDACAPLSCVYSYVNNNHAIEATTTLIGLYGGLVIICRLIAILIVKYILHRRHKVTTGAYGQ